MGILVYLIPIALSLGLLGLIGFLWTMRNNQYEDLDGAAWRILFDDDEGDLPQQYGPKNASEKASETTLEKDPKK
ncbi:cbb3-type cytochrome oxidase assembly protein CcoS [Kordiimonas marina]|uniref:cbb3-type cytochrome oxidase assembly protein CcoS n=1 Tax=Kordiimonas marina TaxID=2872312 RepID=UPI001FF382EE|nr:cbb3-type cytochrome oxidase assembly protein CcoS [Kordiimonas marina]MCJ9427747.1 cbb3-type cytochrome oxidase assembly protein CcoS [Kordiimonas marina]